MILETTVIVSRRDADTMPVFHVRDEWEFNSAEEQKAFTEELILWLDDRPIPGTPEVASFPRKGYKGELALHQILDKVIGVDTESSLLTAGLVDDTLDVPEFMKNGSNDVGN